MREWLETANQDAGRTASQEVLTQEISRENFADANYVCAQITALLVITVNEL